MPATNGRGAAWNKELAYPEYRDLLPAAPVLADPVLNLKPYGPAAAATIKTSGRSNPIQDDDRIIYHLCRSVGE